MFMYRTAILLLTGVILMSCDANSQTSTVEIKTTVDSNSYAIGMMVGNNLKEQGIDVNAEALAAGVRDFLSGSTQFDMQKAQAVLMTMQQESDKKRQSDMESQGKSNKEAGEKFLAENKKKPGVITTASGLQYRVDKKVDGKMPGKESTVKVHYRGTLLDGKVFDSSYDRGEPAQFALNQVIPGWTEGLQLMSIGSKYTFWIPSDLAYGPQGMGGVIAPSSTLVFEVELIEIVK